MTKSIKGNITAAWPTVHHPAVWFDFPTPVDSLCAGRNRTFASSKNTCLWAAWGL